MKPNYNITSAEAADLLRVSHDALRQARKSGRLQGRPVPEHIRKGSRIYYSLATLENWLDSIDQEEVQQ